MITVKELQDVINSTNVVLEELLHAAVETLSLERLGVIGDPQLAFSQLLNKYFLQVREVTKPFNTEKIFTSKDKHNLQSKIDIRILDNGLVITLLKIEDILGIKRIYGKCTNPAHQQICCEDCNANCDHSSPTCKKCNPNPNPNPSGGGTRSRKCNHECRKCKRTIEQCGSESKLCCSNCSICMDCNKELANLEMVVRAKIALITSFQQPCARYLVWFCLEVFLKWRNLFAHKTTQQLQDFINGIKLTGFEICGDSQQLFSYFKAAFLVLTDYLRTFKIKPLQEFKYLKLCEDLNDIFSCGERLEAYLKNNYVKLNNLLEKLKENLERTSQIESKKSQQSSMDLSFQISTDEVSSRIEVIKKNFQEDINVDGPLREIFRNAAIEAIDKCLKIKHESDYIIKKVECEFQEAKEENNPPKTSFGFKLNLGLNKGIFPEELQIESSDKSKTLRTKMKEEILNDVYKRYNLNAKLSFQRWICGSLIIQGEVVIMHGEVSELQKEEILNMIEAYALTIFRCDGGIEQIKYAAFDYSNITFSLTLSSTIDILNMIEIEAGSIKKEFIEKVKTKLNEGTSGKVEKETDASIENVKKGKLAKKFTLTITIKRDKTPWNAVHRWLPYVRSEEEFSPQDCSLTGPLLKIFYDAIIKVLEENNISVDDDFSVGEIHCDLVKKSPHTSENTSNFDFKMHVSEITSLPLHHSNAMKNETQRLMHDVIENAVTDILITFGYKVNVCFNKWGSLSPIMQGTVSLENNKVNLNEQNSILEIILRVTQNLLHTDQIYIELLQTIVDDLSTIEFTIALLSEDSVVINTLERERFHIENRFFVKIYNQLLKGSTELSDMMSELKFENVPVASENVKKEFEEDAGLQQQLVVASGSSQSVKKKSSGDDNDDGSRDELSLLSEDDLTKRLTFRELDKLLKAKQFNKLQQLLELRPQLSKLRSDGVRVNLLHIASRYGVDIDIVEMLIRSDVSVEERSVGGWLPIHEAAIYNHVHLVEYYLKLNKRHINQVNNDNYTPLHLATMYNHEETVKFLLTKSEVDVNVKDHRGMMADDYSWTNDHIKQMIVNHRKENK